MTISEIKELLEKISIDAKNWQDIGTKLREIVKDSKDQSLTLLIYGFEYMYVEKSQSDQRDRYGAFAPWVEMQGSVYPPPLQSLEPKDLAIWDEILKVSENPLLDSRLSDLLWEMKWGDRPDLFARRAVDNYLIVIMQYLNDLEKAQYLIRALEISKSINDVERINQCVYKIETMCKDELSQSQKRPGISFRLLKALLELPKEKISAEIDNLLEQSFKQYIDDTWVTQSSIDLLLTRVSNSRKQELKEYIINRWVKEAEKNSGIGKIAHYQHAIELARNYGFSDVAEDIRKQLQNMKETDLGLHEFSVTTEISKQEIEKFIMHFVETENLETSLTRFGIYGPPSGTLKENTEIINKLASESPIQFLVTQQVLDENNFPIMTAHSIDENKQLALIRQETMGIQLFGTFGYMIIDRIAQKFDFSDSEKLISFFQTPLIPIDIARNVDEAIKLYLHGNFYVSGLLLIPSIEAVFRNIARGVGLSIIHESIGPTPGRVKGLGEILQALNGKMDEDWRRYFYNVLSNPIGLNLRNRLSHGLLLTIDKTETFILLHVICHLRLITISTKSSSK